DAIQGSMGAGECMIERAGLAKVSDDALHGADLAVARSQDRLFRHLNGRDRDPGALGEGDDLVIALDKTCSICSCGAAMTACVNRLPRCIATSVTICTVLPEPVGCSTSTSSVARHTLRT